MINLSLDVCAELKLYIIFPFVYIYFFAVYIDNIVAAQISSTWLALQDSVYYLLFPHKT